MCEYTSAFKFCINLRGYHVGLNDNSSFFLSWDQACGKLAYSEATRSAHVPRKCFRPNFIYYQLDEIRIKTKLWIIFLILNEISGLKSNERVMMHQLCLVEVSRVIVLFTSVHLMEGAVLYVIVGSYMSGVERHMRLTSWEN